MWWTSIYDGIENRGGDGSTLGWHGSCLPIVMLGSKSNRVDVAVSTGIRTNINGFDGGRVFYLCTIDVLNLGLIRKYQGAVKVGRQMR